MPGSKTDKTERASSRRRFIETAVIAAGSFSISRSAQAMAPEPHENRFSRGLEILRRIGGQNFDGPINALAETSADLSRFTVEYPYGDVLSRPGLDLVAKAALHRLHAAGRRERPTATEVPYSWLSQCGRRAQSDRRIALRIGRDPGLSRQRSMPSASFVRYSPNVSWRFSPSRPRRVTKRDADGPDGRC